MEIVFPFHDDYLDVTEQVTEQVKVLDDIDVSDILELDTEQVTEQVIRLIIALGDTELSIKEIMLALKLKHRPTIIYDYIKPAIDKQLIELTQPDSPNSPTQKYRLTTLGSVLRKTKNN